jgi:hypothetical protein
MIRDWSRGESKYMITGWRWGGRRLHDYRLEKGKKDIT